MTETIAVLGAGYVGLTSAVCFAELGHTVRVVDIDEAKIATIRDGRSPIFEAGLEALITKHVQQGSLEATMSVQSAVQDAGFVFLCVPTPSLPDGSADLTYLTQASQTVAPFLAAGTVIVNKSTVPVGSGKVVLGAVGRTDIPIASNPEFLREGTAVHDFMHPDRIVVGCDDDAIGQRVADLYDGVAETTVVLTDPASAELIKYASNAYLATRLTFINAVAEVCDVLGADVGQVATAIGLDKRIGPHFLQPGPGWGGSCFPKDTKALAAMADEGGFKFTFLNAVIASNDEQFDMVAARALALVEGRADPVITALGLAFKAGTDDTRSSPAIAVIERLLAQGVSVQVHDPEATIPAASEHQALRQCESVAEAAAGSDLVLVLTEWPQYASLDPTALGREMRSSTVLDARYIVDRAAYESAGFTVHQIGRT